MTYSCKTCGAVSESPGHLCNPCGDESACSFCGAEGIDARHVCKKKHKAMKFVCGNCGRMATSSEHLCNATEIK